MDGVVGASLAESGDAVEYGQELVVIEFASASRPAPRADDVPQDPHRQSRARSPCASCGRAASSASRRSSPTARRIATRSRSSSPTRPSASARRTRSGRTCSAPAVISAALVTGCDAVHPGYGFLSEDEGFAEVVARPRPDVHRSARQRPREVREQGGHPAPARRPGPADDPRFGRDAARRDARPRRGRADRLPGPHQAVGRRRRQGHAHDPHPARARIVAPRLPVRGQGRLRRRLAVPREVARRDAPRRDPGGRRPLRPRRAPRRARLLGPAPPPEDPRGGAHAGPRRGRRARSSPSGRSGPSSRPATRTSARSNSSSTAAATRSSSRSTAGSRWSTRSRRC